MRKLFGLILFVCLCVGCKKETSVEEDTNFPETPEFPNSIFNQFNFNDTTGFIKESIREENNIDNNFSTILTGIKDKKIWVGEFDGQKNIINEYLGVTEIADTTDYVCIYNMKQCDWGNICYAVLPSKKYYDNFISHGLTLKRNPNMTPATNLGNIYLLILKDDQVYNALTNINKQENVIKIYDKDILTYQGSFPLCENSALYTNEGKLLMKDIKIENYYDSKRDTTFLIGFEEDHLKIRMYETNNFKDEWEGIEKFNRDRKYHLGYGEYEEFYIKTISINKIFKIRNGYSLIPEYETITGDKKIDILLCKEGNINYSLLPDPTFCPVEIRDWYNGSIIAYMEHDNKNNSYKENIYNIIDKNGELIHSWKESIMPYTLDNIEPVSYKEWIGIKTNYPITMNRDNSNGDNIWSVKIKSLNDYVNSKFHFSITNKSDKIWTYSCDIINYDGSKSQENFMVNIETGEITYL